MSWWKNSKKGKELVELAFYGKTKEMSQWKNSEPVEELHIREEEAGAEIERCPKVTSTTKTLYQGDAYTKVVNEIEKVILYIEQVSLDL